MVDSLPGRRDKDRLGTDKDRDSQGQMEPRGEDGAAVSGEAQRSAPDPLSPLAQSWLIVRPATEIGGYSRNIDCVASLKDTALMPGPGSLCVTLEAGAPV